MRILVVKTSAIGDVIHTLPVIDALKKHYPGAQIDWVVEKSCLEFLSAHRDLSRVLLADVKGWQKKPFSKSTWQDIKHFIHELRQIHYDLLFDFQGNTKSAALVLCARAQVKIGYGWKTVPEKPNALVTNWKHDVQGMIPIRRKYLQLVQAYCGDTEDHHFSPPNFHIDQEQLKVLLSHPLMNFSPKLMVAFGSNWKNKTLAEETLKKFLTAIQKKYEACFFFPYGTPEEEKLAGELHSLFPEKSVVIGKLSLQVWRAFMSHMDGVIAMDSAALHLCSTTATPTFSLFGPSKAAIYKPEGEHHVAFQGECPYQREFERTCPLLRTCSTGACLREAPLNTLLNQFYMFSERLPIFLR